MASSGMRQIVDKYYIKEIAIVWVSWMIIGFVADADLKLRPETRVLETVIRIRSLSW